jgi:uncharacterized protein (TIGR03663 family)
LSSYRAVAGDGTMSSGVDLHEAREIAPTPGPAQTGPLSAAVFALALAIALFLRVWQIELRPLHHDEGVNWVLLRLLDDHGIYVFNPRNYHGPTLYYMALPMLSLFGDTELALRGGPAIAGVATLAVFWSLRRWLGRVGTPAAALLAAVSPGLTFFSRDFIHQTLFGLFTVCVVASVWRYAATRRSWDLVMVGVAAGLLYATKETSVIVAVALLGAGVAAVGTAVPRGANDRETSVNRWRAALAELRGAFPTAAHLLLAVGPFVLVILVFYSAFFTRWEGVIDAARAPFLWMRTGISEQTRAWHYYLGILVKLELPLILGGVLGGFVALRRRTRFGMFVTAWTVVIGLAHTLIPYKMPWLIVSMLLPLAVLSGLAADAVAATVKARPLRFLATLGFLVMVGSSGWIAYRVNFVRYDDALNTTGYLTPLGAALHLPAYRSAQYGGYVFAQTDRDLLNLVDTIDRVSDRWSTGRSTFVYVTSPNLQPLPWYLRGYERVVYGTDLSRVVPHSIVVASTEQRGEIERLPGVANRISSFRLRPGINLLLGVRE